MTVEETAQRLNELAKLIAEATPEMTQQAAVTAKSLIQERIQELGQNENEVSLTPYSEEYKKVRQKRGFETSFTNLTFTGQMWGATRIIGSNQEGGKYVVTVGGGDTESKSKLEWNSDRYGDILSVSKKEEIQLQQGIDDELNKLVKQVGL